MQSSLKATAYKVSESVDAMLGYWDLALRCRSANAAYGTWFGRSRDEMAGIPIQELLGPLYDLNRPHIQAVLQGHAQRFERDIPHRDGTIRHSLVSYFPDISDGTLRGFSAHAADVTLLKLRELELQSAVSKAQTLATHDFLTGLPNRVNLLTKLGSAIARAEEKGLFVGVTVIDLDNFKTMNDRHGHDFGDCVLKVIAERMKRAIRGPEMIKRYGGDEFIFIVPDQTASALIAHSVGTLMDAISQPIFLDNKFVQPSFSCGVAIFPFHGVTAPALLKQADQAMYLAKRQGKSRVVFTTGLLAQPVKKGADRALVPRRAGYGS